MVLITSLRQEGGAALVQISGRPGQEYILQARSDLRQGEWANVSTNRTSAGGTAMFRDDAAKNYAMRFYRIAKP